MRETAMQNTTRDEQARLLYGDAATNRPQCRGCSAVLYRNVDEAVCWRCQAENETNGPIRPE